MVNWKDCIVPEYTPSTLCEVCENACGGCSWSEKNVQKPVEGWEAVRNDIFYHGTKSEFIESYIVLSCPKYKPDHFAKKYSFSKLEAKRRALHKAMATKRAIIKRNECKKFKTKAYS